MKTKPKIVLCDLNMEDRGAITANIVLACRIAKEVDAKVVGWCALSSIRRKIRLSGEFTDLQAIADFFEVPWGYVQPKLRLSEISFFSLGALVSMVALAFLSPRRLSRFLCDGLTLGQNAVDSQRRRTLRLTAHAFVVQRGHGANVVYPRVYLSKSRLKNLLSLALVRFVLRAWLNWHFWSAYLSNNDVLLSVQSHTERSEFGPLTRALARRGIPLVRQGELMERWDDNSARAFELGQNWLAGIVAAHKTALLATVNSNLESSFRQKPDEARLYAQTHIGSAEGNLELARQVERALANFNRCLLVILPATYEAFNHDRLNTVFHNYVDWFLSIRRVLRQGKAGVVFKPHPHGDIEEAQQLSRVTKKIFSDLSWEICPRDSSIFALRKYTRRVVSTSLSSSAILEAAFLGIPLVPADVSAYMWWDFAKAPASVRDYEARLSLATEICHPPSLALTLEATLLTNQHRNHHPPLRPLIQGPPALDINPEIHFRKTKYSQSSKGQVLSMDNLEQAFQSASVWRRLVHQYRAPKMKGISE